MAIINAGVVLHALLCARAFAFELVDTLLELVLDLLVALRSRRLVSKALHSHVLRAHLQTTQRGRANLVFLLLAKHRIRLLLHALKVA